MNDAQTQSRSGPHALSKEYLARTGNGILMLLVSLGMMVAVTRVSAAFSQMPRHSRAKRGARSLSIFSPAAIGVPSR